MSLTVLVLAAGQGTRMKSTLPKVLHRAAGRTLLSFVLETAKELEPDRLVVVVGHGADQVIATLPSDVIPVVQAPQLGTGHAVSVGLEALSDLGSDESILIVNGDMPLISVDLLSRVVKEAGEAGGALVTVELPDHYGFGRVLRDAGGRVVGIVEARDATPSQLAIREMNTGVYCFRRETLAKALGQLKTDNVQGEYYLPDVVAAMTTEGVGLRTLEADPVSVMGVNSHDQLAAVDAELRRRIVTRWMQAGVWMQDPGRVYLDANVELAAGARLYPGVHLEGRTTVGAGATIGPDVFIADTSIGDNARVWYAVLRQCQIGEGAEVGPYASLRPGTVLRPGARVGTFVEMKNTTVGEGAKVLHLSYMGDATIGEGANIGAGSITCNYDGESKHPTVIGERAFIGSDTMLVAPITIGHDAYTGAGSVITRDVEPGALAVERSQQKDIPNYAAKRAERARRRTEDGDRHS
jgi:bifunctional UDP-N-acetylglucosamine pyrophosphorylase/glucosamine-1-phosphate N-acetyltransferase